MSAWYVLACLGFYPVNPSSGEFVIGAPQMADAKLHVGDGKTFRIVATNLSEEDKYVKSVTLNGSTLDGFILHYAASEATRRGCFRSGCETGAAAR